MEFGEILDHSIELYRRNLPTFLGIYAVAALPCIAVSTPLFVRSLTTAPGAVDTSQMLTTALGGLAFFVFHTVVLSPITTGAMTIAVSERFLGRPASIAAAYRRVRQHVWPLVVCLGLAAVPLLGVLLVAMIGVVLAAVGGLALLGGDGGDLARVTVVASVLWMPVMGLVVLLFTVFCGFVPAAVVLEGRRYGGLGRSFELAWGSFRRVFGLFAVLFLMVVVLATYVRLPPSLLAGAAGLEGQTGSQVLGALAMQVGILLVDPVRMVGVTLTYYDLRIRREGFDLAVLASELSPEVPEEPSQ